MINRGFRLGLPILIIFFCSSLCEGAEVSKSYVGWTAPSCRNAPQVKIGDQNSSGVLSQAVAPEGTINPETSYSVADTSSEYAAQATPLNMEDAVVATEEKEEKKKESIWDKIEWGFEGAIFVTSNLSPNKYYGRSVDGCFAGDLSIFLPTSERDLFGAYLETGQGRALDSRIPTFAGFVDELHPESEVVLTEAWYERATRSGWRFRVGLHDITMDGFDANEYANCGYYQFSTSGFVNNKAWDAPTPSFGVSAWKDFGESWSLGAVYQNADGNDWTDLCSHTFGMLELDYRARFGDLTGNYRFYGWINDSDYYEEANDGWGFSLDQQVNGHMGLWARAGFQNEQVALYSSHVGAGLELNNFERQGVWGRDAVNDAFGFGYSVIDPSEWYKKTLGGEIDSETYVETYYRAMINEYAHLTPFVILVDNPMGACNADKLFILGLRGGVRM